MTERLRRVASYRPERKTMPAAPLLDRRVATMSDGRSLSTPALHSHRRSLSASYPTTSISKYYALNHFILGAFQSFLSEKNYAIAYAMGLQFVETALLEIPKHGYFWSKRHEQERLESSREATEVCRLLQELVTEEKEKEHIQKLQALAKQTAKKPDDNSDKEEGWGDLSMFGEAIDGVCCHLSPQQTRQATQQSSPLTEPLLMAVPTTIQEEGKVPSTSNVELTDDEIKTQEALDFSVFEQPTEVEIKPAKLLDERDETFEEELERALFLSSGGAYGVPDPILSDVSSIDSRPRKSKSDLDIATLRACYHEDFDQLRFSGRIQIFTLPTYQGRLEGSINGCTLIAPLICIHFFINSTPDMGLPDEDIIQVIDEDTPALLPQVRSKLGLTQNALIIPSDVHDVLLDRDLLAQEQFVTVCGGNILDEAHVNEMVAAIVQGTEKRIAATVFFHEHVVAILKLQRADGQIWFDLIDSLPSEYTLSRPDEYVPDDWESEYVPYAARIRCLDEEALKATLRWYACSKFHEENCAYIDMYAWADDDPDFDPRVFQAFVWAET